MAAPATATASKLYEVDEEAYNAYQERLCGVLPAALSGKQDAGLPPWSDTLTEDEIYELSFLSLGYQLSSDAVAQMPSNLGWKRRIVDLMAYITQETCDNPGLSPAFISIAKNLFLYYLQKFAAGNSNSTTFDGPLPVDGGGDEAAQNEEKWKEIIEAISTCSLDLEPIHLGDQCGQVLTFQDHDGKMIPISAHKEQFDVEIETTPHSGIDIIVDNVWWMFSITYARCYTYFYPNEDIILVFLQRFRDDILSDFAGRWRGAGDLDKHFDLVFGPMDLDREFSNVRMCAAAAYDYEGLNGRELVRPLTVMVENVALRNFKVVPHAAE
ncbi:hypothetical protein Ocin01_16273 [Orchesella cincta]|uniref:Uncharacterized protein n=1 Tax=Orchesella cincta TaxID=48709 RepID=A0A1D2MBN1_ORCCI|nr:hypothetical protein Ocin01_16273 [Orchesella cincta]